MRVRRPFGRAGFGKRFVAAFAALATIAGVGVVAGTGPANAWGRTGVTETFFVNGCGMPGGVKVRGWYNPNNYKTVVLLDGLRATNDVSGWERESNVADMVNHGVNVVMPVGGAASFYSDWDSPSNFNGQNYTYKWNCVIANSLPDARQMQKYKGRSGKLAIAGISMGGNAALVIGANNKRVYSHAFSMSGYLNLSAPGMKSAIRVALLDADGGPWNADSMWGPPWSTRWYDNDPFVQITKMHGLKVRVASGNGGLGGYNAGQGPVEIVQGVPLEWLSLAQSRAFEVQALVNGVAISTDYPAVGTHMWGYWQDMMWRALQQGWFRG